MGPRPSAPVRLERLALARAGDRVAVAAPAEVSVLGDADALARALGNLIENALVHGPPGGAVRVEVREAEGRALLSVSRRGPGLRGEDAERAFERFWRANPRSARRLGTGPRDRAGDRRAARR